MLVRHFGVSVLVSLAALAAALAYGGRDALALCLILGVLEVSLSFDNAVVNATVLRRMSPFWQRMFLTVGILVAVFGMRLVFPLLIVGVTADVSPLEAFRLAMQRGDPDQPGTYGYLLTRSHPQVAAFGGLFLLMLFLDWVTTPREDVWLAWLERPLARVGGLAAAPVLIAGAVLVVVGWYVAQDQATVLVCGLLGLLTYLAVSALVSVFEPDSGTGVVLAAGRSGFFLFLYLEVLDASFSFDGVLGAFAITNDPVIIALGLGLIGAIVVRSFTVYLVRREALNRYAFLEHGAHWAIGVLAVILLAGIADPVDDVVTGLTGVGVIAAAVASSLLRNRRLSAAGRRPDRAGIAP